VEGEKGGGGKRPTDEWVDWRASSRQDFFVVF
jgi:hypothetical protein